MGAIEELGCRAVLHVTELHVQFLPYVPKGTFLLQKPVPHAKLFELCGICVHHGGASDRPPREEHAYGRDEG